MEHYMTAAQHNTVIKPPYPPAEIDTMYFIGVTTGESSIMNVFPAWAEYLGLDNVQLKGINLALHDEPAKYREAVDFIKNDPKSRGALVTTHKIDLFSAAHSRFDRLGKDAVLLDEVSSIYKRNGLLYGEARDAVSSGLSFERLLPKGHLQHTRADLFIIGAGGSSIALSSYVMKQAAAGNPHPKRVIVSNRSEPRLKEMERIHRELRNEIGTEVTVEYRLTPEKKDNDMILAELKDGSIIANGTGLGKDAPGSPITDEATFPRKSIVWDFNYRGDLLFLDQARKQEHEKRLKIVDGWDYFIYGWTSVIADVFHIEIPTKGTEFEKISEIASNAGR